MTRLLDDIRREPAQISRALNFTLDSGRTALRAAADAVRDAPHTLVVGIGASWNAALAIHVAWNALGRPAHLFDASELLHFSEVPPDSCVILLSRSGKSVEIVRLIAKCRARQAKIVAITNAPESPLARQSDVVLLLNLEFDHSVSVSMYSALAAVANLLVHETEGIFVPETVAAVKSSLDQAASAIPMWLQAIDESDWLQPNAPTYFLARGLSLASCFEAALLWQEAAKAPACAMSTGSFRHGPQEIVRPGLRIGMWIDSEKMRDEDLALTRDLRSHGARVLLIGQRLPSDSADLQVNVPPILAAWQFLSDIIPVQLAAERLAASSGENCDAFRLCPYVIEGEAGLPGAG